MKKYPSVHHIEHILKEEREGSRCQALVNDKWVAARPLGFYSIESRFKIAWMVFTGKADALLWEGQ